MPSFGWLSGVHYAPYASDEEDAVFSCVLVMPWLSGGQGWNNGAAGPVLQEFCKTHLEDWLAPWAKAKVRWQLLAGTGDGSPWTKVGNLREIVPELDPTRTAVLRKRAVERLHWHVIGHADAMGFEPGGPDGSALTYPVVSPGLAQMPAPLSDSLLGTSAVHGVAREVLADKMWIAAVPVFHLNDSEIVPTGDARKAEQADPDVFEFLYPPQTNKVDGVDYVFTSCVVKCIAPGTYTKHAQVPPRPASVRSRMPDRQLYAEMSRRFWPLRVWLTSLQPGAWSCKDLCLALVRLLGCGEDELENGTVVGSVYQFVLEHSEYCALFPVRTQKDHEWHAACMVQRFNEKLASPDYPLAALKDFQDWLLKLGLKEDADSLKDLIKGADSQEKAGPMEIAAARRLQEALAQTSRSAHPLWAAWLATVLPTVASDAALGAKAARRLVERARQAMDSAWGGDEPVVDDDILRVMNGQIDYAFPFWEDVHGSEDLVEELKAQQDHYLCALEQRLPEGAKVDGAAAFETAWQAIEVLLERQDPQADDPPLQLRYRSGDVAEDGEIRGWILALRAGLPTDANDLKKVAWNPPAWISTFHLCPAQEQGFGAPLTNKGSVLPAVFLDTQGATQSDGLAEQVSSYDGIPLLAAPDAPEDSAQRSPPEMFKREPRQDSPVPPLAYGMHYQALCGTVDNAGVIVEEDLRQKQFPGLPKEGCEIERKHWGEHALHYLSRQPPGTPVFSGADDAGVAQETLSFHSHDGPIDKFQVAVLYDGKGYASSRAEQTIQVHAPTATPAFVQRWLQADLMLARGSRWDAVNDLDEDQLRALVATASSDTSKNAAKSAVAHPAVSAIELRVRWINAEGVTLKEATETWRVLHLDGAQWRRRVAMQLNVRRVGEETADTCICVVTDAGYRVDVPKGMRARIEAVSIVDGKWMDGLHKRFLKSALVAGPDEQGQARDRPYKQRDDGSYESLGVARLWLESLPDAPTDPAAFSFDSTAFSLQAPSSVAQRQELTLRFGSGTHPAQWVSGLRLELKRWQWTGYPVKFPASDDLKAWLPLYSGTPDVMPALPDARFTTSFAPGETEKAAIKNWVLKDLVAEPVKLASPRPASHMGIVVHAIPRFASLLEDRVRRLVEPVFVYRHVLGVSTRRKLPPPLWMEAIPLPKTSVMAEDAAQEVSPGNLIVLKDPPYDTGDTGAFGGIAERLEIDVVSTWSQAIDEVGPNPIFHGAPVRYGKGKLVQPTLVQEPAFGLGYDRVVGGRPAQTGLIVRPKGSKGQWLMAKCRIRRVILPHLVLDSVLTNKAQGQAAGWLEPQQVEDGWIPGDFAVYADEPLSAVTVNEQKIRLPSVEEVKAHGKLAYLVTWHRDSWGEAAITWRPLVHVYQRSETTAHWKLVARIPPIEQAPYPASGMSGSSVPFQLNQAADTYRVDASDYTDSRWLTFIGSFGQELVTPATALRVRRTGKGFALNAREEGTTLPQFRQSDALLPSLLLVFAPQRDLMRGRIAQDGGELVGVYATSDTTSETEVVFDQPILEWKGDLVAAGETRAIVIQLQRRNTGISETLPKNWSEFVDALFPREERLQDETLAPEGRANEARARLLPEYIGPLTIE